MGVRRRKKEASLVPPHVLTTAQGPGQAGQPFGFTAAPGQRDMVSRQQDRQWQPSPVPAALQRGAASPWGSMQALQGTGLQSQAQGQKPQMSTC